MFLFHFWTKVWIVSLDPFSFCRSTTAICFTSKALWSWLLTSFNRRQMVLSRFWFGFYGVKLSMLAELAFARRIKLTYEPQSPASMCLRVLAGPP